MSLQDIYKKAGVVMKPAAMKDGKLYSQQPHSGAGDFNFSRADGVQTRINKHGLIETVADNVPRLSYDLVEGKVSDCPHLLLEPQRANYIPYSNFDEDLPTGWVVGFGVGDYTHELTHFRGQPAIKHTIQSSSGRSYLTESITLSATTTYTFSMHIDLQNSGDVDPNEFIASVSGLSGVTGDTSVRFSDVDENGVVSFTFVTGSDISGEVRIGFGCSGTSYAQNKPLIFSMPQIENGSYPTSYIPTSGSTETRQADICNKTGVESLLGQTEGTLFLEFVPQNTSDLQVMFQIRTTGSSNVGQVDIRFQSGQIKALGGDNDTTQFSISGGSITEGANYKAAIRYKANDVKFYINGSSVGSDTVCSFTSSAKQQIGFAENLTSFLPSIEIKEAVAFNEALTDEELQTLTTP